MNIFTLKTTMLAIATAAAIAGGGCSKNPTPSPGLKPIRIAQWGKEKYLIYLPVYIAQEKGLFAKRGLEVTILFSGNDNEVFQTVVRGDAQFGVGDPIFAAISRSRGADGSVVAAIVDRVALWGVAKAGAKPIRAPADFAGQTIGTFPRPSTTYTLVKQMIENQKVPDAKIVEIPIGSEMALLESGNASVVMMLEPAASIAESRGYQVITSFPLLWGSFAFTGLTTTETWANANGKTVADIQGAIQDALNLAHNNPDEAIELATKLFPTLDAKVVKTAVRRMLDDTTIPKEARVSLAAWNKAVLVRQEMGELPKGNSFTNCLLIPAP